jgi:holo-[acyl-carrier protein] synthase
VVTSERERCGIDSVEIARVARLLEANDASSIARLFSPRELADAGEGPGRAASLAARFAAKEACLKLFPRETALETIVASDFSVERDAYGAPQVVASARRRGRDGPPPIARIALSMTHDAASASAWRSRSAPRRRPRDRALPVALPAVPPRRHRREPAARLRRARRRRRDRALAQMHYAHLGALVGEFLRFRWLSERASRRWCASRTSSGCARCTRAARAC